MNAWAHSLNAALDAIAMELFSSLGENLEEQLGAAPVQLDVAELVQESRSIRP